MYSSYERCDLLKSVFHLMERKSLDGLLTPLVP
jgi:hypothetical protein